jgi:thiol:disulfide interchange protein
MENTSEFVPRSEKFGKKPATSRMQRREEKKASNNLFAKYFKEKEINKLLNLFEFKKKKKVKKAVKSQETNRGKSQKSKMTFVNVFAILFGVLVISVPLVLIVIPMLLGVLREMHIFN